MLKKILPIFFILCLVFSLTVPCFAGVNFISNSVNPDFSFISGNHYNFNVPGGNRQFCSFTFDSTHTYYLRYKYYSGSFVAGSYSLVIFITSPFIGVPTDSAYSSYDTIITGVTSGSGSTGFICRAAESLVFDFVIFDITDLYSSTPDLATVRSDLSFYTGSLKTQQMNNSVEHPFIEFYSHIFEPFSYITEIGQTGYFFQPLILIGAVVGLLVFIFVCVFLIKRFTGGKT